jgi:adducin
VSNYTDEAIHKLLSEDIGPISKVIFVRNYGVLACGETIEEAWHLILNCVCACEIQSRVLGSCGGNLDLVNVLSDEQKKVFSDARQFNELTISNEQRKWKVGELEFEACMRTLDNAVSHPGSCLLNDTAFVLLTQ